MSALRYVSVVVTLASVLAGTGARANGRIPNADDVQIGPGRSDTRIVVRNTFGLLVSDDRGATFDWICEEALSFTGTWDPPTVITHDGALEVGLVDGLVHTPDGCASARTSALESLVVRDLTVDADGTRTLGVANTTGAPSRLFELTSDGASASWLGGASAVAFQTLDAAPSMPLRVYATALRTPAMDASVLYRSDDGGATLHEVATDIASSSEIYLAAIDPRDADTLWLRTSDGTGTQLRVSHDAGATTTVVFRTADPMTGFAISDDGARVWVGSVVTGVHRSDDRGATFLAVSAARVTGLRYHAGALYIVQAASGAPWILARWTDGDASPVPLLRYDAVTGPRACADPSRGDLVCGTRWPTERALLHGASAPRDGGAVVPVPDGGFVVDVGDDAAFLARDATGDGAIGPRPSTGCSCGVESLRTFGMPGWVIVVPWLLRRGRGRGRGRRPTA